MKCGTTSLYHFLRQHPDIFMPREKEVDFFSAEEKYKQGPDWYKSKFEASYQLNGEASPNYSKAHLFEDVPERIYDLIPDIKLIYLYREPVERVFSHYIHNYSIGVEEQTIDDILYDKSNYIMTSKYYWQLEKFRQFFNEDQILIVDSEKLKTEKKATLKRIFTFLEVKPDVDEISLADKHRSATKTKRSSFNDMLLNTKIGDYLRKLASDDLKVFYKKMTEKSLQKPEFTASQKEKIIDLLEEDKKKFDLYLSTH